MHPTAAHLLLVTLAGLAACTATAPRKATVTAADGLAVSYEIRGTGSPALVFVHGWCCDKTFWGGQLEEFARSHRVAAVDLGGHGDSGMERSAWTMEQLARDAEAVIRHENLDDVILVGHSMGGPVALKVARSMPERVIGVIGVDTLQNAEFVLPQQARQGAIRALEEDFAARCAAMSRGMVGPHADPELTERIVTSMAAGPADVAIALLRDFLDYDPRRALREAGVPIRCINAVSQQFPTAIETNRNYAPGFDAVEMDGVGHFLMMEKPREFNALLADAIQRIGG